MPQLKSALIVLFLVTSIVGFAQEEQKRGWDKDNLINWSDFQGPIDQSSSFDATTHSGMNYSWKVKTIQGQIKSAFTTTSFMNKSKSWTKPEKQTPALLKHEQLHFDIYEFFARKLLQVFNDHSYTNDFTNEIAAIFQRMEEARKAMEDKYDKQTNHSKNKLKQAEWELYVSELLSNNYSYEQAMDKEPSAK
jgi:hypothetical protein